MFRRILTVIGLLLVLTAAAFFALAPGMAERSMNQVEPHAPYAVGEAARALHESLTVADLHSDSLLWRRDITQRSARGHVDLPRLAEGNVALQVFSAVTKSPAGQNYERNSADSDRLTLLVVGQRWPVATWSSLYERARHQAEKLHRFEARAPESLKVILTAADLDALMRARGEDRALTGGLLAIEGAHALEGKLENVQGLYDAGYRMVGLHHFFDNELGGSLHGTSRAGLSEFGREVVKALEARSMIVDVAHSSQAVVDEVLAMAARPVVVSHTGVRAACETPRNISDNHMRRIAAAGGLIGIGYWDAAVCDISPGGVVRAIRAAVDLVGADHVALGSDYDGSTTVAFDASELSVLTDEMLKAGFTEDEIRKVMGGNVIRFLREYLPKN